MVDASTWLERRENAMKRLAMFLHKDDALIETYLSLYGLRVQPDHVAAVAAMSEHGDKNPAFEIQLICPACEHKPVTSYMHRGDSQKLVQNTFMVPIGTEGVKGYYALSPLPYSVHVCPKCGYASSERDEWATTGQMPKAAKKPIHMTSSVKEAVKAGGPERLAVAQGADIEKLSRRPRDLDALVILCRLGLESERLRVENGVSKAAYRSAGYHLRIAAVAAAYGETEEEETQLRAAIEMLETEYAQEGADQFLGPISFLMLALAIQLGEDEKAGQYRGILMAGEKSADQALMKWISRGKEIWDDWREDKKAEEAANA